MTTLFKKLNFKEQKSISILNAPDSFKEEMDAMKQHCHVLEELPKDQVEFVLGFALEQAELNELLNSINPLVKTDAILWLAYPKKSSKKYKTDISRDKGWSLAGEMEFEAVRLVAIDQDWSVIRLRKVHYIKKLTRKKSFTLSAQGKERADESNTKKK